MSLSTQPIPTVSIPSTTKEFKGGISKYEDITDSRFLKRVNHCAAPSFRTSFLSKSTVFSAITSIRPVPTSKTKLLPQQVLISHCLPVRTSSQLKRAHFSDMRRRCEVNQGMNTGLEPSRREVNQQCQH